MSAGFEALLDDLRARGDAPAVRLPDRAISAAQLAALARDGRPGAGPAAGEVVTLEDGDPLARVAAPLRAWALGRSTLFLPEHAGPRSLAPASLSGAPATLLLTSGSAGEPKVVVTDLDTHIEVARRAAAFLDLRPGDTWLQSLAMHHVGGLGILFRTLVSGAALAVPAQGESLADSLARYAPTHVSLVATQLRRLLADSGGRDALARCRCVLVGGGPVPVSLRAEALDADVPLVVSYGATETTAFVTAGADPKVVALENSAGAALPGRALRIAESGEILVGGEGLMRGYYADGVVSPARDADGFFATGDRGRLDEHGVLFVEGRLDRMLISGGENVQPEEIEAALLAIDGITSAAVVPVSDAEFGQRPVAFVAWNGDPPSDAGLRKTLRKKLPGFKVPDAFYLMPQGAADGLKPPLARLAALLADDEQRSRLRRL